MYILRIQIHNVWVVCAFCGIEHASERHAELLVNRKKNTREKKVTSRKHIHVSKQQVFRKTWGLQFHIFALGRERHIKVCLGARIDTSERQHKSDKWALQTVNWDDGTNMLSHNWDFVLGKNRNDFRGDHLVVLLIFLRKVAKLHPKMSG